MACAPINVGRADDHPSLFAAGNPQFRVRYDDHEERGSIDLGVAAYPGSFMQAAIESDEDLVDASHWATFDGIFAVAEVRYDIPSLWPNDDVEAGVDPNICGYDAQEVDLPETYRIKRSGLAGGRIAFFSPEDYIESRVSGADRAWSHRVAYPQFNLKF
jgi:hypothetical protein